MWWECSECGAELERVQHPVGCPECGRAGVIFVRSETPPRAGTETDEPRAAWLEAGLRIAATRQDAALL